jgi:transcriptional regulator with XRE-family HTH domain
MRDAPLSSPPEVLASALKGLIDARGLKQKALAAQVGLTESSLSMILNAKARPRQLTLTRLLNRLNCTPEEEQTVLSAYDHAEGADLPLRPGLREKPIPPDELERVRRYLKIKAESMAFEDTVEGILKESGLSYERGFRGEQIICDIFIPGPPKVAIECKYNVKRDWDRTLATAHVLKEGFSCDAVIVVVPSEVVFDPGMGEIIESSGCHICGLNKLESLLRNLSFL